MSELPTEDSEHRIAPVAALRTGWQSRGYLPHLRADGGTYFVTFRLADALPMEVLASVRAEREGIEKRAKQAGRTLPKAEKERLRELYEERIESYLDSGDGKCWLKYPEVGSMVVDALMHFDRERYVLHAWVVMSNHVHVVATPQQRHALEDILHSWKSFTAHEVQNLAQASRPPIPKGRPFWQRESYDRLIRDDAELVRRCDYTIRNPVKAGLCSRPEDWPLSSVFAKPRSE